MDNCNHYWVIDRYGNARCRYCGATAQFPLERVEFTHFERTLVEQYNPPQFWQLGALHGHLEQVDGR